jgi:hypothetical protein
MSSLLETIESIENGHDVTVSSFPLRRDLLRSLSKIPTHRHNLEHWDFLYEQLTHQLLSRLARFKCDARTTTSAEPVVKRGIFKGLSYENARAASFFLRHAKVRNEYTFGSSWNTDPECVNIVYACIIFPTPGHLDFRHNGERIELFQGASGRILTMQNKEPERIEGVGHGLNVLQDFIDDIYGYTEAQLAGRTADFSWDDFRDAFEPFLVFQINEEYARHVR